MEDNYVLYLELGKLPRYISYINANVMNGVTAIRRLMTWKIKVYVFEVSRSKQPLWFHNYIQQSHSFHHLSYLKWIVVFFSKLCVVKMKKKKNQTTNISTNHMT